MSKEESHAKFGNGFVWGMAVGALLVLLFTTKKGRRILKVLSEEGFEKMKHWEGKIEELDLSDDEIEEGEDYIVGTEENDPSTVKVHANGTSAKKKASHTSPRN
jgi:hypothetical protein